MVSDLLAPWASAVLSFLGANALYAALIAIPLLVVDGWLARRANRLRSVLWAMVMLRLMLPTDLRVPWSWDPSALGGGLLGDSPAPVAQSAVDAAARHVSTADPTSPGSLATVLFCIWALGAMAMAVGFILRRRRLCSSPQRRAPAAVVVRVAYWARRLGLRRTPDVQVSTDRPAIAVGLFRPRIVLPETNVQKGGGQLDAVIVHELQHLRRRDDHRLLLGHVVRAAYFFHPIAHVALRRMADAHERACDAAVLNAGVPRQHYARLLLTTFAAPPTRLLVPSLATRARRRIEYVLGCAGNTEAAALRLPMIAFMGALLPVVTLSPRAEAPRQIFQQAIVWQHPLPDAYVSSGFGMRPHPENGRPVQHTGVDLVSPLGTPVFAAAAGVVRAATSQYRNEPRRGTVVVVEHSQSISSYYGHLGELLVRPGQRVDAGTPIAEVGLTGFTNGPHLHFEIWNDNTPVRPDSLVQLGSQ